MNPAKAGAGARPGGGGRGASPAVSRAILTREEQADAGWGTSTA
jgi:hypothetical protein